MRLTKLSLGVIDCFVVSGGTTISKLRTIDAMVTRITIIANLCPMQEREPKPNVKMFCFILTSSSSVLSSHRSGLNTKGSGKICGSRCTDHPKVPTTVPAGTSYPIRLKG